MTAVSSSPRQTYMSPMKTFAATALVGTAIGALGMRPSAFSGAAELVRGMRTGALVGAGLGALALIADRVSGGEVHRQLNSAFQDRRAQGWFVLKHLNHPWLASTTLQAASDARAQQHAIFGSAQPLDGPHDAFRHAYAGALLSLRLQRDRGMSAEQAADLTREAGDAHEQDGQDNSPEAGAMDRFNNAVGIKIASTAHAAGGSWVSEQDLINQVVNAMATGRLQVVDHVGDTATPRATTQHDLP